MRVLPRAASLLVVLASFGTGALRAQEDSQDCRDQHNTPCSTGQPGVCAAGLWKCSGQGLRCQRITDPSPESCGNGLDDDCDGTVDEGNPGGGASCQTGAPGICAAGTLRCASRSLTCQPDTGPQAENCGNGLDDDCDGAVDGADASCTSTPCPDADGDGWFVCTGTCRPGSGTRCGDCDDGRADVHPNRAEVCNGRDDDCDGDRDEGNPGGGGSCHTGQAGICAAGTLRCASGSLRCERNLSPRDEDCDNGLDDDCDGATDLADGSCAPDCGPAVDSDGDQWADCADNCPGVSNSNQQDFDGDGLGDACETGALLCDVDRSGRVDGVDLGLLGRSFGRRCGDGGFDRRVDLNRDCGVDGDDLALLASFFGDRHQ